MKRRKESRQQAGTAQRGFRRLFWLGLAGLLLLPPAPTRADVTWSGLSETTDEWSDAANWVDGAPPIDTDVVVFNANDSENANVVDGDYTIAGLQYVDNSVHRADFDGTGSLQIDGPVYVGYGVLLDDAEVTWTNGGNVTIGDPTDLETFWIGTYTGSEIGALSGTLILDGTDVEAFVSDLTIGKLANPAAIGTVAGTLVVGSDSRLQVGTENAPGVLTIGMNESTTAADGASIATGVLEATDGEVELHLTELNLGRTADAGTATATLVWDQTTPIDVTNAYFGRGQSWGIVEVPIDGTLLLGTDEDPLSLLAISHNDVAGVAASTARLEFTDQTFEAFVDDELSIGRIAHPGGQGVADGVLRLGRNSRLRVGTEDAPAVLNIGMNEATLAGGGEGSATGTLDATQGDVELHLTELNVGRAGDTGTATGRLEWNQPDPIDVTDVYFGRGQSTGILNVPVGGTMLLGTPEDPVSFMGISYHDTSGDGSSVAQLNVGDVGSTFEAHIDEELSIGEIAREDGTGTASGGLVLGEDSHLYVGTVAEPGVVNIGRNRATAEAEGSGDGIGLLETTDGHAALHLTELNIGRLNDVGGATGLFIHGAGVVTTATTVNVGAGDGAIGTLNMKGGRLSADTINMGDSSAFDITGGRLAFNTYNTYENVGRFLQHGGTLAPGVSRTQTSLVGLARINGDYSMTPSALLEIELFGEDAYDQLAVTGYVDLDTPEGNGMLDVVLHFGPETGMEFLIVDNLGDEAIEGEFEDPEGVLLAEGAQFTESYLDEDYLFEISYLGGTGNDIVLRTLAGDYVPGPGDPGPGEPYPPGPTVDPPVGPAIDPTATIPAPGAVALASMGAGLVTWLRRRRRL